MSWVSRTSVRLEKAGESGKREPARRPTRRLMLAAGLGLPAAGVVLAACGGPGSGQTAPAGGAAPAAGLQSGVTVSFFHGGTDPDGESREEILKRFEQKYPGIKTEHLFTPDSTGAKLDALISAGTAPDVFYVGNGADVTTKAAKGVLYDLTPLAKRDKFDTSDFFDSAVALYHICSKQYAYPIDFPNQELYYNVDLFEQAGVKPPPGSWTDTSWTFDRFLDAAKRLTKEGAPGGTQWGYITGVTGFRNWWVWVAANGGEVFDKDLKTCTLDDPAAVEAFQFLQDLIFKYRVLPNLDDAKAAGGNLNGFTGGRAAMSTLPPWLGQVRRDLKQRWDVAPHPRGNSSKARWACAGGGTGLAMASPAVGGKHINEAWELLKFSEQPAQVETYIRAVGIVPPLKSVANSPAFADPSQPPQSIKVFVDGAQYLRPDPSIVRWDDITRAINEELAHLWDNSQNARTVAGNIKRKVDSILAEIQASGQMACRS